MWDILGYFWNIWDILGYFTQADYTKILSGWDILGIFGIIFPEFQRNIPWDIGLRAILIDRSTTAVL